MKLLEFGRSTLLFRLDLDILQPRTLSHKPPFAMNNARIQIDSVCRITERASGKVHTFVLGGDCKTERVDGQGNVTVLCDSGYQAISGGGFCGSGALESVTTKDRFGGIHAECRGPSTTPIHGYAVCCRM